MRIKYALLALITGASLFSSCTKDKVTKTSDEIPSTNQTNSSGDGLLDVLGYGYNVTGEFGNPSASTYKIVDVNRLQSDYPNRVETDLSKKQEGQIFTSENAESYATKLSATLKATTGFAVFKSTITASYSDANSFSSKYIYSSFDLMIQEKRVKFNSPNDLLINYLTPEFTADVQNNSAEYIVRKYGTHVLSDIILGAKLQVLYQSETSKSDRNVAAAAGLDVGVGTIFNINTGMGYDKSSTSQNSSQRLHYKTYGGNPSIGLIGSISLDQTAPTVNIANWQSSSSVSNAQLIGISNDGLIPIYDLITDPGKKAQVQSYVNQYMIDNGVILKPEVSYTDADMPAGLRRFITYSYLYPNQPSTKIYPSDTTPALSVGQFITSPNGRFKLILQPDGNLVLYRTDNGGPALWSTGTQGNSIKSKTLYFQPDGHLVMYQGLNMSSPPNWNSGRYDTTGQARLQSNAFYALQDDGNFVFYFTYGSNPLSLSCHVIGATGTNTGVSPHQGTIGF